MVDLTDVEVAALREMAKWHCGNVSASECLHVRCVLAELAHRLPREVAPS